MMTNYVVEETRSFLKVISFTLLVEDRRPDLTTEQAQVRLGYKYKVMIFVRFFNKNFSMIFHTLNPGFFYENRRIA